MGNILNHNRDIFNVFLNKQDYWDFHLSLKQGYSDVNESLTTDCLVAYIDTTDSDCVWFDSLFSKSDYKWSDSINDGIKLDNIGYTGVDNGLIHYEKDKINNETFYNLFTKSTFETEKDDLRLKLNKIYGNNQIYDYVNEITDEDGLQVMKLNGGFYQGFFKLDGHKYQILPTNLGNGWNLEFTLKKDEFDKDGIHTLNDVYPSNKGIFFYIGTRAENKWWLKYKTDIVFDKSPFVNDSDYMDGEYITNTCLNSEYSIPLPSVYDDGEYFADDYVNDDNPCCGEIGGETTVDTLVNGNSELIFRQPEYLSTYNENALWRTTDRGIWLENEQDTVGRNGVYRHSKNEKRVKCNNCTEYFMGDYVDDEYYKGAVGDIWNQYVTDEYIQKEMYIDVDENLLTKDGFEIRQPNVVEFKTNNKFLIYDRTKDGFDINTWNDEDEMVLYDIKIPKTENYFLLFNRTKDGYTTDTIQKLLDEENKKYNVLKDLYRNALCFQITDDGKIGYKYLVKNCDDIKNENYMIESEFSDENVVSMKKWHVVNVKIVPLQTVGTNFSGRCEFNTDVSRKMKICIYVDGKLKLISKELPMFNFKRLDDLSGKQEGVPYNISIGGGTQGLCDMITLNYREPPQFSLPLEKEFGGSFIGFIKSFKFYDCPLNYSQIFNNFNFESNLLEKINIY